MLSDHTHHGGGVLRVFPVPLPPKVVLDRKRGQVSVEGVTGGVGEFGEVFPVAVL